jgi:hypothetical protein
MSHLLLDLQIPILATVLLLASLAKLTVRDEVPAPPVRPHRHPSFVYGLALAEGTIGVALLVTQLGIVRLVSVVFFASATWVIADLRRRDADEGCSCFGGLSSAPAGRRGLARVALLTFAALVSAGVPASGAHVLGQAGAGAVLVILAETALLLALSPELTVIIERTRNSTPCELLDVPIEETYARMYASQAWREFEDSLTSARPAEVWRELCHRFVVFPARVDGRVAEVVFAVPIDGRRSQVRAALAWEPARAEQDDDSGPRRVHSPA